jgi:uncharacterized protein
MANRSAAEVLDAFEWEYLEGEGVWFQLMYRNDHGNAIYGLITPSDFSALHMLEQDELWVHHDGDPVQMVMLHPDGRIERPVLGRGNGMVHHVLVPAGTWQGARTTGDWTIVVCALAPPFTNFQLASSGDDFSTWPAARDEIAELIR